MKNTHGLSRSKTYRVWTNMKRRCLVRSHPTYKHYGARNIKICEQWLKFENFYKDMGEAPIGKSLDRVDNEKGYDKENCRWATPKEQNLNTRRGYKYRGIVCKDEKELQLIKSRIQKGWKESEIYQRRYFRRRKNTGRAGLNQEEQSFFDRMNRVEKMSFMRSRKYTLSEIGKYFGVSWQRVQQLLVRPMED